jgi:DNA (cytosine-5)-methyltransferase 1
VDERESAGGVAVMRYVELFAGAGGLSLGLEAAGMECVAHAELEPHARAVLRKHWPDTPLHGDVSDVDWTQYAGRVDLVSGGSPCQDLSVAGKRAGLEGARSGLFFELIRAWDETGAPYCLWENVDGARSSNAGADFASVLSTLVGAAVAVPERWASAGVAAGPTGVAAWRVLDLQRFGPPQRRRRVFVLAARAGGCDPAEILALGEGLCGHPAPRERTGQGPARGARASVAFGINSDSRAEVVAEGVAPLGAGQRQQANVLAFQPGNLTRRAGADPSTDTFPTLGAYTNGDQAPHVLSFYQQLGTQGGGIGAEGVTPPQKVENNIAVLAFRHTQDPISGAVSTSIGGTTDGMGVVAFSENQRGEVLVSDVSRQITTGGGKPGQGYPAVLCATGHVTHALTSEGCDASEDGTGRGTPIVTPTWPDVAMPLMARDAKGPRNFQDGGLQISAVQVGRPRRLTPLECERLMSWPDQWTAHGLKEDGIEYALSDTARYRLCGNGVGSVVAEWIARRLVWAEANNPIAAPRRTETR